MLTASGFAYAPNAALEARLAPLAAAGKLRLGDAQDEGVRAAMAQVGTFPLPTRACALDEMFQLHAINIMVTF